MKYLTLFLLLLVGCADHDVPTVDVHSHPAARALGRDGGYGWMIYEFEFEGCQYIAIDGGMSHKGNCTNQIHLR